MSKAKFSYPIRATYGEVDRGHGLRFCSAPSDILPGNLLELTDKPPGHIPAGELWGPSIGCGPIGEWWALWWTEADTNASRAGMGLSEVAVWPLDAVSDIDDLGKELATLNGGRPVISPDPNVVASVAEALIDRNEAVPVFGDLELWPGLLAALWPYLWREARKSFSARVAISPPQSGMSASPPLLYGVAKGRLVEWSNHPIVRPDAITEHNPSRAARCLMGTQDPTLESLIKASSTLGPSLSILRRIARAADRLDAIRAHPDSSAATDLLRTLQGLSQGESAYAGFQREAAQALLTTIHEAPFDVIMSLANIQTTGVPDAENFQKCVETWISSRLPEIPFNDAAALLTRLNEGKAEVWWIDGTRSGIAQGGKRGEPAWTRFLLEWLCAKPYTPLLQTIAAGNASIETQITSAALSSRLSTASARNLVHNATALGWSQVHAVGLMALERPGEAIRRQLDFKPNPAPGLEIMIERLPMEEMIDSILQTADERLLSLVAMRTSRAPSLISAMDLESPAWRVLWEAHVIAGGDPWPTHVDARTQARKYLSTLQARKYCAGIVSRLASDFGLAALDLSNRDGLWALLDPSDASELAKVMADLLLDECDSKGGGHTPENFLRSYIQARANHISLSAAQVAWLLEWDQYASEFGALERLRQIRRWSVGAEQFGLLVSARGWKLVAKQMTGYYRSGVSAVLPAIHACFDLLGIFDLWRIPGPPGAIQHRIDRNALVFQVAEIGATTAYDRLEDVWIRAGGSAALLPYGATSADRWRKACTLAHEGMLAGGLLALVRELRADFPGNDQLRLLEEMLRDQA